jgi:hypothetical protein
MSFCSYFTPNTRFCGDDYTARQLPLSRTENKGVFPGFAAPQGGDYTTLENFFNDYRPAPATLGGTARYEEVANQRLSTPAQPELPLQSTTCSLSK